MRTFKFSGLAASVGLLSCSAVAHAADLPLRTAPPAFTTPVLVNNWDGFYAGSTFGYAFTNFDTKQVTSRSVSGGGQIGGGLVGYNFQTGHFVYGAEGSIDLNVDRRLNGGGPGLIPSNIDSMYDIRLRGRLGYEFGWFMPFVAGGAVINETYQSAVAPTNDFGEVNRTVGYTLGAGVDVKLNPSKFLPLPDFAKNFLGPLILRVEYLHDQLPDSTYKYGGLPPYKTHTDSNVVRVAVISRFGDSPPRPYLNASGEVNWAGPYGGIFGGGSSLTPSTKLAAGGASSHFDATGGMGGLYAGTNFIFWNRVMLGLDGSTAFTDVTGTGAEPGSPKTSFRNYIQADLRGRVGYTFGNFLPFLAGGVLFGRSEQIDTITGSERGRVPSEALTVGAGLDYRVSERISVRAEYLYATTYDHKIINIDGCVCSQTLTGNLFRVGAAYHFE